MRLQYQLNIAFTTLLLVILTMTGFTVYSLILNLLIQDEERQLEQKGELLVNILNEEYLTQNQFNQFLQEQDLQLFIYDRRQEHILYSTMPEDISIGIFQSNDFTDDEKRLWEYNQDKFVTSKFIVYPPERGLEMIILTPLSDLEIVRHRFFKRLIIVFLIGAVVAVLLSYFLTNKLVTPLSRLKMQLKKIEKRQFDALERVKATGEIKEVEQSVYDMANELQRYMESQQTFFQNVSHELKTPLMTIQGYAEGIKDRVFTAEEEDRGLEMIVREVTQLKKIINEMILLAKLDSEQGNNRPVSLQIEKLIDEIHDRFMPLMNEQDIQLQKDIIPGLILRVDQEKFTRALTNLMNNAIRHAKRTVRITAFQQYGEITLTVEDDGEGIQEDLLPHIFQRFIKGKSGETGLGLAIARAVIERAGGTISVGESSLGGAKFIIKLYKGA